MDVAVYNSEDGRWYPEGDAPWKVRNEVAGRKIPPLRFAIADSDGEAVEKLFGHPPVLPPNTRAARREEER